VRTNFHTNAAFFQNPQILFLECLLLVVLVLIEDVFLHGFDELRRILLQNLNDLSGRKFLCKITENMNVVGHATNRD
jgi:hypothetical protein